jgi:thioredoxin
MCAFFCKKTFFVLKITEHKIGQMHICSMKTVYAFLSAVVLLIACQNSNSQSAHKNNGTPQQVDAATFSQFIESKKDAQLIDVRTPGEFQGGYINGAMNLDINGADYSRQVSALDKTKPVLVYCLSGGRSATAARGLRQNGFSEVIELQGGIMAWNRSSLPLAGATAQSAGMDDAEFKKLISTSEITLVDFHAPWCAPCKKMKPILEEIAKENSKFKIEKINVDENKMLAQQQKINVLPTMILFKNGVEVWRHEGIISKEELVKALNP